MSGMDVPGMIPADTWREALARELRGHLGTRTHRDVAHHAGVNHQTIGSWFRGHRNLTHPQLIHLCSVLDVRHQDVLDAAEVRARRELAREAAA